MLRLPKFITFTGFDEWTDIEEMLILSRKYPIEWGILFSPTKQGREPRFPAIAAQECVMSFGLPLSMHLCGGFSRDIMGGSGYLMTPPAVLSYFKRVQVNHGAPNPFAIAKYASQWGPIRGIAQCRAEEFPVDSRVDWLFDTSGGHGILPAGYPPYPDRFVGYAGGINPDNVREVIQKISATGPYWIDMESGVRTNDRFDLEKCRAVCEAVYGEGKV